jgi:hypothetical protein
MSSPALAVPRPPRLFASLSQRDRRLLMACLAMVAVLIVVVALIAPQEEDGDTTPSSYSSESHGTKAAYLALGQSGYHIERWERPFDQLAAESDAHTVLIVAEPNFKDTEAAKQAIAAILALALSQLALASGDRVGLLAYGNAVQQRVGLGRGAPQLRQLIESLAQVSGEYGEADHLHATVTLNRMQPRRSLVLWITDMAETSMRPEVVDGAMHLMRRHLMLFVAMRQTDVVSLAGQRPEDRRQMFDIAAAQELVHRRALLMAQLRDQGALTIETEPENLTAAVLNRYLDVKEQSLL